MTAKDNIRAQLATLSEQGTLPKSACSKALLKFLKPLLDSSVVAEERLGPGRRLAVRDVSALQTFFKTRFPDIAVPDETPSRIAGVARFRDSKTLAGDTPDIVLLRAWSDRALWCDGVPVAAGSATSEHGLFSFVVSPPSRYELRSHCALVENPAMLLTIEQLDLTSTIPIALYAGGRVSSRVLNWLADVSDSSFRLTHFPDYDPVGLSEFQRLHARLGNRVTLHMPNDLEARFAKFSNRELLKKGNSQSMLAQLRHSDLSAIRCVVELIDRYNAGLEQEALLVITHA